MFFFSEKKIVHEQKKLFVSCLLCWMVFTKTTRYFLENVFVRFSSVLVAPESWQLSGKSPERSKSKNKKYIYILGGFSGGWYLFESLLDWFIQKIVKNVSYCWYTKLIHLIFTTGDVQTLSMSGWTTTIKSCMIVYLKSVCWRTIYLVGQQLVLSNNCKSCA